MDQWGLVNALGITKQFPPDVMKMASPVECRWCGKVYDLGSVTVTARHIDCSVWKSPCCNRSVDDRGETGWKPHGDYTKIDKQALMILYRKV